MSSKRKRSDDGMPRLNRRWKRNHSENFIYRLATSEMVDKSAFQGQDNTVFLPYRTVEYLFGEYVFNCIFHGLADHASLSTFRRAYKDASKLLWKEKGLVLKLSGGKGKILLMNVYARTYLPLLYYTF